MSISKFEKQLAGGDLRSVGNSKTVISEVITQSDFDELFKYLFHAERLLVMRSADAIEKITIKHPQYLADHKNDIIQLCETAEDKELKWHLALLLSRLPLTKKELGKAWHLLTSWVHDKTNSRIVRVNALQGLFELLNKERNLTPDFISALTELEKENIPSINARIRKLKKQISGTGE